MELLRFEADAYCRLMSLSGQILAHFQIAADAPQLGLTGRIVIKSEVFGHLGSTLGEMRQQLVKLDLPLALRHLDRMRAEINDNPTSVTEQSVARGLYDLTTRIVDELEQRLFLNVPLGQSPL